MRSIPFVFVIDEKSNKKTVRLNFHFHQYPRFRESLDCSAFIVEWWRTPRNGHTDALRHEIRTSDSEIHAKRTRIDPLLPAKGRSMAVQGRIVAQPGQSQHSGVSHRCHLLSRDLGSYFAGTCLLISFQRALLPAMPLLRVYAMNRWIVKGNLPVITDISPVSIV